MTEHRRPPACHYDRTHGGRVTTEHRDDCEHPDTHRGCKPCTAPHCAICGREHATNDQPQTCPGCQLKTDQDLVEIRTAYAALGTEALEGGRDGQLVAAAPIPGGAAAVLIGPTVRLNVLRVSRKTHEDHHHGDPMPPLAILAQWEDIYRAFLGHEHHAEAPATATWGQKMTGPRRATIGTAITYLRSQLPYIAQRTDGPDYHAFTRQVRDLRARLERALHNERDPERGVQCFECGDQLERRWHPRRTCVHPTPARLELQRHMYDRIEALRSIDTLRSYGLFPTSTEYGASLPPSRALVQAARMPCDQCDQGGIEDPSAGQSWECPGCRKHYDPGEYATAVRRDLIDQQMDGAGWCLLTVAADAAAEIAQRPISATTIRTWIARNDNISTACVWRPGQRFGMQIVYWPEVLDRATETRRVGRRERSA